MGLDRHNIPDEYLCEVCKPRPVDRKRAKAMQSRRRTEIFNNTSSSDENSPKKGSRSGPGSNKARKLIDGKKEKLDKAKFKKGQKLNNKAGKKPLKDLKENDKNTKKPYRKRKPSDKGSDRKIKRSLSSRKSLDDELSADELSDDSSADLSEPKMDAAQSLRSWIDQYEEAVTNHYSPEL